MPSASIVVRNCRWHGGTPEKGELMSVTPPVLGNKEGPSLAIRWSSVMGCLIEKKCNDCNFRNDGSDPERFRDDQYLDQYNRLEQITVFLGHARNVSESSVKSLLSQ